METGGFNHKYLVSWICVEIKVKWDGQANSLIISFEFLYAIKKEHVHLWALEVLVGTAQHILLPLVGLKLAVSPWFSPVYDQLNQLLATSLLCKYGNVSGIFRPPKLSSQTALGRRRDRLTVIISLLGFKAPPGWCPVAGGLKRTKTVTKNNGRGRGQVDYYVFMSVMLGAHTQ